MAAAKTYKYTPLADPSRETRIFTLHSRLDCHGNLTGSLAAHRVPRRHGTRIERFATHVQIPLYIAISHLWGSGRALDLDHVIIIDGQRFPVTKTIYDGLSKSRIYALDGHFWIDSICINQDDAAERSQQIPLMCDIYQLAWNVVVWLGGDTNRDEIKRLSSFVDAITSTPVDRMADRLFAFDDDEEKDEDSSITGRPRRWRTESQRAVTHAACYSAELALKGLIVAVAVADKKSKPFQKEKTWWGGEASWLRDFKEWEPNKKQLAWTQHDNLVEIADLLEKVLFNDTTYFQRMWTLQELCVSSFTSVEEIHGDALLKAAYYVQRKVGRHDSTAFDKITTCLEITRVVSTGRRLPLPSLIDLSAGRRSTDQRDRIYALYGLMNDTLDALLEPDYTLEVSEVYANTTRHLVFTNRSLNILCGQQLHDRIEDLPSWVPDYRFSGEDPGVLIRPSGENVIYNASNFESHSLPPNPFEKPSDWQTLLVKGIFIDRIAMISDIPHNSQAARKDFSFAQRYWASTFATCRQTTAEMDAIAVLSKLVGVYSTFYQDPDHPSFWTRYPKLLQYMRSLIGEINLLERGVLTTILDYMMTLLCGRISREARISVEELLSLFTRVCIPDSEGIQTLRDLCKALVLGVSRRRFAVGDAIGAVPIQAVEGDVVCVLLGCSVPVVLRPTTKEWEWEFVGECYWHGYVDGEASKFLEGRVVVIKEFKLV